MISELIRALRDDRGASFGDDVRFVAGQGLRQTSIESLMREAEASGRMRLFSRWERIERASGPLSHKRKSENTAISTPLRVAEDQFEADLCLDGGDALLTDHVTGQHIAGMVLVEAARQMFLASFERYFNETREKMSFLVTEMNNAFLHFAFPVATRLRMTILEKKIDDRAKLFFHESTRIYQAERCVFEQTGRILVCRHQTTAVLEIRSARQVLTSLQASLQARSEEADRVAS